MVFISHEAKQRRILTFFVWTVSACGLQYYGRCETAKARACQIGARGGNDARSRERSRWPWGRPAPCPGREERNAHASRPRKDRGQGSAWTISSWECRASADGP